MEIADFLRGARKRLWVLILIPLLAAGAATYLVMRAPTEYTATSTIAPPALVGGSSGNQYTGSQAVSQYVAAFQATATGPVVRQTVATKLGLKGGDISNGLEVQQVGASSAMTVTFTSTHRDVAEPVVGEVVRETLQGMFTSQVDLAQQQVKSATADLQNANAAISDWEAKHGMVAPDLVYQSQLTLVGNLQQQQDSLQASGEQVGAAVLATKVADAKAGLKKFGPLLSQYHSLTAFQDAATVSLTQARQAVQQAQAQQGAADPTKVAFVGGVHPVNKGSLFLSKVAPVTGAAIFIAVFVVAMLELLARSRQDSRATGKHASADTEAARVPTVDEGRRQQLSEAGAQP